MNLVDFDKTLRTEKFMLPPLSGYTDFPYRQILAQFSPPFMITEMVNARALIEQNKKINLVFININHYSPGNFLDPLREKFQLS